MAVLVAACGTTDESASAGEPDGTATPTPTPAQGDVTAEPMPDVSDFADNYETRDECAEAVPAQLAVTYDIAPDEDGYQQVYDEAMASCDSLPAEPPAPEVPEREGRVEGFCDVSLDSSLSSGQEGRYKALASVDAINTGDSDITVEVWVEFTQLGAEPLRYTETVRVATGETETVHFDENIDRNQWSRFLDGAAECDIGGEITFGDDDFAALIREQLDSVTCSYIDGIGVADYVTEIEDALAELWEDRFADVIADVVSEEC